MMWITRKEGDYDSDYKDYWEIRIDWDSEPRKLTTLDLVKLIPTEPELLATILDSISNDVRSIEEWRGAR